MAQKGLLGKWLFSQKSANRAKKLEILHSIGTKIVSSLDLDELIRQVVEAGVFITETEAGSLYLLDRETNTLYEKAYKGPGEKNAKLSSTVVEEKIFRKIMDSKQPIIIDKNISPVTGFLTKSIMFVPLISRGRALGLLSAYNLNPDREFTDNDTYFLSTVANYGAIAIDNAGILLETEQKVTKSLLSFENLKDVLQVIVVEARRVLEADIVNLYEYDEKHDNVILPPVAAGKTKTPEVQAREGHYHRVAAFFKLLKRKNAFYAPNAREQWLEEGLYDGELASIKGGFIDREGIISSVGIPLMVDNDRVGLLFVNYRSYQLFTPDQKRRIEYFASQAALAIKVAKVIAQAKDYLHQLSVLEDVSRDISSSVEMGTEKLLALIHDGAGKLLDVTNFYVACYDEKKHEATFKLAVEKGIKQTLNQGEWMPRVDGNGLTEYVIRTKKPLLVNHGMETWLQKKNINKIGVMAKSWLGAPMISRNRVLGVVAIQNLDHENAFDNTHIHFLTTIASQAAIALDNTRLLGQAKTYNEVLENLRKLSSSILQGENIVTILQRTAHAACELTDGDYGMILLTRTGDDKKLYLEGFYDNVAQSSDINKIIGYPVNIGRGVTGRVAKQRKAEIIPNVSMDRNYIPLLADTKSEIAVPLIEKELLGNENIIGVLNVESRRLDNFNDLHQSLLERLASLVIIAIDSARKVDELERTQKYLKDSQSLAIIGLLYGEDLHLANNKLGAAQQFAKNIIEYAENVEQARDWAQKISKNIGMVLNVIEEMRVTVNPPSPVAMDIRERVNEVLEDTPISKGIKIIRDYDNIADPTIIGYHRQVGQVFRVVIYNALDAIEGDGVLTIKANELIEHNKRYVQVKVSDTGEGIPGELQQKVFELGGVRKSKRGFGMGLAWCRLFLQMTGGDIKLDSKDDIGTTVTILIPKDVTGIAELLPKQH